MNYPRSLQVYGQTSYVEGYDSLRELSLPASFFPLRSACKLCISGVVPELEPGTSSLLARFKGLHQQRAAIALVHELPREYRSGLNPNRRVAICKGLLRNGKNNSKNDPFSS